MDTRRISSTGSDARTPRVHGAWVFALLFAAPFVAGAKGCDQGVVGDECPKGSAASKTARCGGTGGGGATSDAGTGGQTDGGSVPPTYCGGITGAQCPDGEYCNFPPNTMCGAADQRGTCTPKLGGACTEQYAPVCGCDGKTYGNACSAAQAGVSILHAGECATTTPPTGKTCGGLLGTTCNKGEYCHFGSNCGAADQTGTCEALPMACDLVYAPVCGCDGKTYGNDCEAASHGVSVAKSGACGGGTMDAGTTPPPPPPPATCGGLLGKTCPSTQYCSFAPDAKCGAADQTGTCVDKPQICDDLAMPVCGCDGKTYANSCYAARAGASVAATGACSTPPTGKVCGGLLGAQCDKGQYCNFPPSATCGAADQTGTCAAIPTGCTKEYVPVCGCDSMTYGNACMAAMAGTSVASTGACATGASCGSRGLPACGKGQYCNFPASANCGVSDAPGKCAAIPQACTQQYAPVCGCDGQTYGNACSANAVGVSVKSNGACP